MAIEKFDYDVFRAVLKKAAEMFLDDRVGRELRGRPDPELTTARGAPVVGSKRLERSLPPPDQRRRP